MVSSLYNLIAKVLRNMLKEVLEEIISMARGAFVRGRQILDVALVSNEVVEDYISGKKRGTIFKLDFEKAYDYVRWDSLVKKVDY